MRMRKGAGAGSKRIVETRHVIHLIKIECSSFDVQRLCHECTSGISVPADGGYRYRSWQRDIDLCGEHHERASCQSSSCCQGGHGRGARGATVALHGSRMPQVTVDFAS